jgi:hypothetical protein
MSHLTDQSIAALRGRTRNDVVALPEICIEFLGQHSLMSAAINDSRNPHAAATTILNKNIEEIRRWSALRAKGGMKPSPKLSDEVMEAFGNTSSTWTPGSPHPRGADFDGCTPEEFHAYHPDCDE